MHLKQWDLNRIPAQINRMKEKKGLPEIVIFKSKMEKMSF